MEPTKQLIVLSAIDRNGNIFSPIITEASPTITVPIPRCLQQQNPGAD